MILALVLLASTGVTRADPVFGPAGPDGTRTITWNATDPALGPENLQLDGAGYVLGWRPDSLRWAGGADLAANGTVPAEMEALPAGVVLREDLRNYLEAGDLDSPGPWTFSSNFPGELMSAWDPVGIARVAHASAESPRLRWESFDTEVNWTPALPSDPVADSDISTRHSGHQEGTGMMQDVVTTGLAPGSWAGVQRVGPFNWSAYDRLMIWISSPSGSGAEFGVTVFINAGERATAPVPLLGGWQPIMVDLSPLGEERSSVSLVQLRFYGTGLGQVPFFLDDLRLSVARGLNGTGSLSQTMVKADTTSPTWGTCLVSLRWRVTNVTAIASLRIGVDVIGPSRPLSAGFDVSGTSEWDEYRLDVSPAIASAGDYEIVVWANVRMDTTEAANASVEFDAIRLQFPARQNATFVSRVLGFGGRVETVTIGWNASVPGSGSARVALRAGDSSDPVAGSWGPWTELSSPGVYGHGVRAPYFQVRVALGTANASETPRVETLELVARHRASGGRITTPLFDAEGDFARWSAIVPWPVDPSAYVIEVGNGSAWTRVTSAADLADAPPSIQVRATLVSPDRVESPRLTSIRATYDVIRPPPAVWDWVLGNPLALAGLLAAAGGIVAYTGVVRQLFAIEDVFLVARDGRLIMHNTRRMRAHWDEDTFAGMLTAISAFVRDSFREDRGELNRFEFSGKTVLIERVDSMYVAALYAGRVPSRALRKLKSFVMDLEGRYGEQLRSWSGSPEDLQDLKELTDRFVGRGYSRSVRGGDLAG